MGCLKVSCQWAVTDPARVSTLHGQNRRDSRFHSDFLNKQLTAQHLPSQENEKEDEMERDCPFSQWNGKTKHLSLNIQ